MKCLSLAIAAAVFAFGSFALAAEVKDELAKLQGDWRIVELIVEGKPLVPARAEKRHIAFDGDTMLLTTPLAETEAKTDASTTSMKIKLDPKQSPAHLDATGEDGMLKDKTLRGIYEVKDDTLRICIGDKDGTPRPTEFKSTAGSAVGLLVLKRVKKE